MKEDITPLQTKVVSISVRNTPLRDVLYTIAEAVNLNLVMEAGVKPDLPVTMTLNNMVVQDALNVIFNSVDYFYTKGGSQLAPPTLFVPVVTESHVGCGDGTSYH